MHARTGARLRLVGADPLSVRWLARRQGFALDGVDLLGGLYEDELTAELQAASLLVAPSLGGESFGMVLTRAFACATPVVASDIEGYAQVADHDETGILVPPGDAQALGAPRWSSCSRTRSAAAPSASPRGRPPRSPTPGSGSAGSSSRSTSGSPLRPRRSGRRHEGGDQAAAEPAGRLVLVLVPIAASSGSPCGAAPTPARSSGAFRAVEWEWVAVAVLINLFSVVVRATPGTS